ncbi:MAG: UvrD-helicase domain-containing protein [Burkholderiales bacterium]
MPSDALLERQDAEARARALDVRRSFLVQAPAGSGKTGLLIQRVLALLAIVERPEAILAMTFTRKAAAEMRERVLRALRDAEAGVPVDATRPHDVATRELALAALRADARGQWHLVANPSRLKVLTIDALATSFARRVPLTTGLGALPAFVDDARGHYREAVADALAAAPADDPRWRDFLLHLDNDAATAVDLLAGMLARRDQWRSLSVVTPDASLRPKLEAALRRESENALRHLLQLIPADLAEELVQHQAYAAEQLRALGLDADLADFLQRVADDGGVPAHEADALADWRRLADWLLVKDDARLRADWNKNHGFPPRDKAYPEREAAKAAFKAWAGRCDEIPGLCAALHAVRTLPPPVYTDAAWAFVAATLALLPTLAAHLQLVFARTGETDFSEASLRALTALGDAERPGDLLLAADLSLAHVLVDEFQDTSASQLELIARLTAGWSEGDGRTLFAVGDPMQSIYRFREAEVRHFLDARAAGRINHVPVECLTLTRNFRSRRAVIDWVNGVFPNVLPVADAARGEVAYAPVLPTRDTPAPTPTVDLVAGHEEPAMVVRRVQEALAEGAASIAILVRARTHLADVLPALRAAGIDYVAVDLESLAERMATRDLLTLARALTQPDDRLAALALLRAPWCGLTLADLLAVAEGADARPVLLAAADPQVQAALSADGRERLARLLAAIAPAMAARGRLPLAPRVRAAWLALGGPACVDDALDLEGAEVFLALLARHERGGDIADWADFAAEAAGLFAEPPPGAAATVQVMTLHKAKGLEFDTVIIPGLGHAGRRSDDPPLRWERRGEAGTDDATLLLAPLHARVGAASERDPVYGYLTQLAADQETAELGRLLYVGCTRAQRRLHLIGTPAAKAATAKRDAHWAPAAGSALARLWEGLTGRCEPPVPPEEAAAAPDGAVRPAPPLARLPLPWTAPPPLPAAATVAAPPAADERPLFDWAQATAAAVGTVTHRLLAQVAAEGYAAWNAARVEREGARIALELAREGVDAGLRPRAAQRVAEALTRLLADERGAWIFHPGHAEARSEWALASVVDGTVEHVTLDRTFVVDGVRWIVDFKTGQHEGGDPGAFLDQEVGRYRAQLERYARIVRTLDPRPVRLALYHPLVAGGWREWEHVPEAP